MSTSIRGRYAPSPTGLLHVGNARTALVAWLSIRQQGGRFVWRLEDLDPPRVEPGAAERAIDDLRWLGLDWDEGPEVGGPHAPYVQSQRSAQYEAALETLAAAQRLFPCTLSRKDLQSLASAPHGRDGLPPYPAEQRPASLPDGWFAAFRDGSSDGAALRFRVAERPVRVDDRLRGTFIEDVGETVGDFVLKRKDGLYAYQLAVVVDDLLMDITEIVRGADLVDSTARQIQLIEALGGRVPDYAHVPLVLNAEGEKLSKRDDGLTLQALRAAGITPEALTGYLAFSLGLRPDPTPVTPAELVDSFAWPRIRLSDWVLPNRLDQVLSCNNGSIGAGLGHWSA